MGKFGAVCRGIAETVVASFAAQVAVRGNAEFGCAGIAAAADADIQSFIRNKAVCVVDDRAVFTNVDTIFIDLDLILFAFGHQNTVFTDNCFILFTISDNDRIAGIDFISVNTVSSDTGIALDRRRITVRLADAASIAVTAACTTASAAARSQAVDLIFQRFHIYAVKVSAVDLRTIHLAAAQADAADLTISKTDTIDTADACHYAVSGKIHTADSRCCRGHVRCLHTVSRKAGNTLERGHIFTVVFGAFDTFRISAGTTAWAAVFNSCNTVLQVFDIHAAHTQTVSCVAANSNSVQIVRRYRSCYQTGVIDMRTVSIGI